MNEKELDKIHNPRYETATPLYLALLTGLLSPGCKPSLLLGAFLFPPHDVVVVVVVVVVGETEPGLM